MAEDLDGFWSVDEIFASGPTSLSFSEQPWSPRWTFSDAVDHLLASDPTLPLLPSEQDARNSKPTLVGGNTESINDSQLESNQNGRIPPPVWLIVPPEYSDGSCVIKERMTKALLYFKEMTKQHFLAQVWVPVRKGDRYVLTTSGLPFVLDPNSNELHQYRRVSMAYMFSVDEENYRRLEPVGRVFKQKLPEWTPNVQYLLLKRRVSTA